MKSSKQAAAGIIPATDQGQVELHQRVEQALLRTLEHQPAALVPGPRLVGHRTVEATGGAQRMRVIGGPQPVADPVCLTVAAVAEAVAELIAKNPVSPVRQGDHVAAQGIVAECRLAVQAVNVLEVDRAATVTGETSH
jgi:hypothetical protein